MKIVFLSRNQNSAQRGAENFVNEISKELSKSHEVQVLSGKEADSIELYKDFDVVVPINGRTQSLKASLGRLFKKYKLLITGHSGIGRDDIWNITFAKPDVFVALTEKEEDWAKKWAWGSKVVKIPNGVDLKKFSPTGEKIQIDLPKPVILSVGALDWYKYHDRAIEAVSRLDKGSLLVLGKGPLKQKLADMGKKLLGERFKIESYRYDDMPEVYRSVDLFTLPSWDREAFGLVYLEAMASGLGIVAPDDSSRREIVGDAGILVEVSNIPEYANAIEQALKSDWSKKAKAQAEKFSWDKIAKRYEEVMLDLLKS